MIKRNLEAITFLTGSVVIIFLSFLLNYHENVVYLQIFNVKLGNLYSCPIDLIFHLPCPTCGLSRAFILFSHGKFNEAFTYNPSVFLLFPYLICQIPFQIIDIIRNNQNKERKKLKKINLCLLIFVAISILVIWVLKLFRIFPIL